MRIHRLKNIIGLCACEGCRNKHEDCISIKLNNEKTGKTVKTPFNLRKFCLCNDCTIELTRVLKDIEKKGIIKEC